MGIVFYTNARQSTIQNVVSYYIPQPTDTIKGDTLRFPISGNSQKMYLQKEKRSPLFLKNPSNVIIKEEYNPVTGDYEIRQEVGGFENADPIILSADDYKKYRFDQSMYTYWNQHARNLHTGTSGDPFSNLLNPQLNVGIDGFDKVFGTNTIDIKPTGSAEIIFGLNYTNSGDPSLPVDIQKDYNFEFDEKIQLGVTGQIGDKLKVGINYNTEASFEFENKTKLGYTGKEDEIIQNIEAGDVSFPLNGTLIPGSHSLFGIKTDLKFGNLYVSSVISRQEGKSQTIEVKGGAQVRDYEISAADYEANRHFFVSHYFKENYERSLANLPVINSGITITRIEVWVTNKTGNFDNSRNLIAAHDLGEAAGNIASGLVTPSSGAPYPANGVNNLYQLLSETYAGVRDINQVTTTLQGVAGQFDVGRDYEKIENARLLLSSEYSFNAKLGYISLNAALNADEVLAVAYEYTMNGQNYTIGELSISGVKAPETLIVKLLKGTALSPKMPTWELMMKNVYAIGAYQISPENFKLEVYYQNDNTGTAINYLPEGNLKNKILLQVLNLDRLNSQLDPGSDGYFDFMEKTTINSSNGRIFFPQLNPFGDYLGDKITDTDLAEKYTFQELYDSTQSKAKQIAEKNKYLLKGSYQSASGSEIALNAMNIPQGAVKVTAGGAKLVEGNDYLVDYTLGRVTILNQGLLESGTPISISLESNELFNFQTKTLLGTHFDYRPRENITLGATLMHLSEKPFTNKVNIGDEPISNTIWGLDASYSTEADFLTRMVDFIPFIETKEKSTISFTGEFAHLIPGHSDAIEQNGVSYIDDFEGSKTTIDLKSPNSWSLASIPQGQPFMFPEGNLNNNLASGYNRAKISWYSILNDLLRNTDATPGHLRSDPDQQSNHLVREVYEKEIFPYKESLNGYPTPLSILNLAFYPEEKGPYNFDGPSLSSYSYGINADGLLNQPNTRWAGITRRIQTNDFEAANIEYIEFWMMDPFAYDSAHTGGDLYFNLGNISEDILRDSRKSFENGLPADDQIEKVDTTAWGRVPVGQSLINAFDNNPQSRQYQDIGLDGLNDEEEATFFKNYLDSIATRYGTSSKAYEINTLDPSGDNYHYFRGSDYDNLKLSILDRYKNYNGMEGNSPTADQSPEDYPTSGTLVPDVEDINTDNTLSETESYFQYKLSLRPEDMVVGKNYITDMIEDTRERKNKKVSTVRWYQFKIPIYEPEKVVGNIEDFRSIRFIRMFLRNFDEPVVLRFARLDLVRGEWRKYNADITSGTEVLSGDMMRESNFEISAVNVEENGKRTPVNYILPPGIRREEDPTNPLLRLVNEQSLVFKVFDLSDGEARAAYRNVNLDVRQYERLRMEVHAEAINQAMLKDGDVSVFIRLGADYQQNYYEYEIPVKVTKPGFYNGAVATDQFEVWPAENQLNIVFELLQQAKQARNDDMRRRGSTTRLTAPYTFYSGNVIIRVMGNPNLSNIRTIMLGIRNPKQATNRNDDDGQAKSAEIWLNELRLTDFREDGGWAATGRVAAQMADFGTLTLAGSTQRAGFGSLEKKINERLKEDIHQYDLSANLELGKFFPQRIGLRIPMYVGYSESFKNPLYNPLDPDIELEASLKNAPDAHTRDSIRFIVQDYTRRRSINFTNVKVNAMSPEPHFYDVGNWSLNYAYTELFNRNINTTFHTQKTFNGGINYTFNNRPLAVTPFKNVKAFNSSYFKILREFNFFYAPTLIAFRTEMARNYSELQNRNISNPDILILPNYKKDFLWNRVYDVKYDLSRNLKLDFASIVNARIDEPDGRISRDDNDYEEKRDTIWQNVKDFGRVTHYDHKINLTYTVPINKLPGLDWVNMSARYGSTYQWDVSPRLADSIILGNTIRNGNNKQLTTNLNFQTIYNKIKYLQQVNQRIQQKKSGRKNNQDSEPVSFELNNLSFTANTYRNIEHNLATEDVSVKAYDSAGRILKGTLLVSSKNKIRYKLDNDAENVRIEISGRKPKKMDITQEITDHMVFALMGVQSVTATYTVTESSQIPGYLPGVKLVGMSSFNALYAPGFNYILGVQDQNFPMSAGTNGWLTKDSLLNAAAMFTQTTNLNIRATVEPLPGFKIDITAERNLSQSVSEYWVADEFGNFSGEGKQVGGNFKMSYNMLGTAFWGIDATSFSSKAYDNFMSYRIAAAWKLANKRADASRGIYNPNIPNVDPTTGIPRGDGYPNGYSSLSQEVLIPAFLAAYANKSESKINTGTFPQLPALNWNVTYDGLMVYPFFKEYFKNFTIRHAYKSSYNVNAFTSNPMFSFEEFEETGFSTIRDPKSDFFIPENEVGAISIEESFSPLISFDMTWKNSLTTRIEFRKSRMLSLSFANNQLEETYRNEYIVGAGYRISELPISMNIGGNRRNFKSDLNLRADFSFRDDMTVYRKIEENIFELFAGMKSISFKTSADYMLTSRFTLKVFYDHAITDPRKALAYKTTNAKFGISIRVSLIP